MSWKNSAQKLDVKKDTQDIVFFLECAQTFFSHYYWKLIVHMIDLDIKFQATEAKNIF